MEITNTKGLEIIGIFELLDRTGSQFTPQVTSRITSNRFELSDITEANKKYVDGVKAEFAKTIGPDLKPLTKPIGEKNPCFDVKSLDHASQDDQELFYDKFQAYLDKHEGYKEFLEKKVKVDLKPIYLKDLEKCTYQSTVMWLLKDTVLFKEKGTIKPSIN